ncbi:hypothetical protein BDV95DRAFT_182475 [Massariosphaeria phaeospora]|uniref:Uncharacterized protein n=1 Tax=Massariosphaeria phaeospora TaxID=100035 RepID=A0A7C8I4M7_9PLEO|nr:hypothetical protein BDV95DRAFT_182475 [Massariosphaeria phaeospora]
MSFDSFPMQNFQFVSYNGPLEPKPTWRRKHTKTMPPDGHEHTAPNEYPSTSLALPSHQARDIDLVSAGEYTCDLKMFSCKGDIGCLDGSHAQDDKQGMKVEHFVPRGISVEVLSEKSSGQLAPSEGNSLGCAIVIADNQSELDTDNNDDGYPHDPILGTQNHDGFGVADVLSKDHYETEGIEDALILDDGPESQHSGPGRRELFSAPSTSSTGPSIEAIEQRTQEANRNTLLEARVAMHQPQEPVDLKAEALGESAPLESTSGNNSDRSESDTDDDTSNQGT